MNRLKELRIQHGYKSQKELADVLFVNQTAVSQWERGVTTPSSQMLQRLSELYQVSIDYLLGRDEKDKPTLVSEDGPTLPPEYEFLNPTNKAIVDRLIADLVKGQPSGPKLKIYAAALDGGRYETEADADITLPDSVQALPDEYKGKTAGTDPARQEQ